MAKTTKKGAKKAPRGAVSGTLKKEDGERGVFLASLVDTGNVTKACEIAKIGRRTAYNWRAADEKFAAAWEEAKQIGLEGLEDEARRRAHEGWDEPKFHDGKVCGHVRKFSDTLLIFLLKGGMPEKYKERATVEHSGNVTLTQILAEIDGGTKGLD